MSNLSQRPSHIDGNLGHRPSHIDGNLSHRPSHADVKYMKKSPDEKSSFPNNFWFPEPAANISTEKNTKENTKQKQKEKNKTDVNNNSRA